MKILGTGLNGLVGSRISELLKNKYTFENLSRSEGIDITDEKKVKQKIAASDSPYILHLAGATNVDESEKEIDDTNGSTYTLNVLATRYISEAARDSGKKVIYFSTDFVFDGEKEFYSEEDMPHPINWYGKTKLLGEEMVEKTLKDNYVIARIAFPYRAKFEKKLDLFRTFLRLLEEKDEITVVSDQYITPTFVDDIANAVDLLIKNDSKGIFHIVGSDVITPSGMAKTIAENFPSAKAKIREINREEFYKERAQRPFRLALENDKIISLGAKMKTFEEGLEEIKKQLE